MGTPPLAIFLRAFGAFKAFKIDRPQNPAGSGKLKTENSSPPDPAKEVDDMPGIDIFEWGPADCIVAAGQKDLASRDLVMLALVEEDLRQIGQEGQVVNG